MVWAGTWLLLDETYRELADAVHPPTSILSDRVISVSSLSKTCGVTGIRVGWLTCRDRDLMTRFLAAQEQIALAHPVLDLAVAEWIIDRREPLLPAIRSHVSAQRRLVKEWIAADTRLEWVEPVAGVVCFPRLSNPRVPPRRLYEQLQSDGIFVGPGWWFQQPDQYFRLGHGDPTGEELETGLAAITTALDELS